jgi:hypothetical protein
MRPEGCRFYTCPELPGFDSQEIVLIGRESMEIVFESFKKFISDGVTATISF